MSPMREESEQLFVVKPQFQNAVSFAPKNLRRVENVNVPQVQEPRNIKPPPNHPFPRNRGNRRRGGGRRSEQGDNIRRNPRPCTANRESVIREAAQEVILPNGSFGTGGHTIEHESASRCSSKDWTFPSRPGFGQLGTKCIVKANHFFAELPDKDLNHYDVTITPEVKTKAVNRAIIAELVKLYRESHLGMRLPAYDGSKSLYTAGELPFIRKEFNVKLIDEENNVNGPKSEREYKVVIKFVAKANLHHLGQFLAGKHADGPKQALQILDIVLRELSIKRLRRP